MRTVIKSGGRATVRAPTATKVPPTVVKPKRISLELPTEASEPDFNFNNSTLFIHGEEKIGKTTLAAEFEDAFFCMFEPGGRYLRIKRRPEKGQFKTWEQFESIVDKLEKSDLYQTIIIDTVDRAWILAENQIVESSTEDYINDGTLGFGKGGHKTEAIFSKQIARITATGRGVVFLSHTKSKQFEKAIGGKTDKLIPTVAERARAFLKPFCDGTFYYGYFGKDRYLVIEGDENLDAGHRMDGRFLTPKGKVVHAIPMGNSAKEGYENILTAYDNKQIDPCSLTRKAVLSEVKASFLDKKK